MRTLSDSEVLSLKEILEFETNSLEKAKIMQSVTKDNDLKEHIKSSIVSCEDRIKGFQQFISENDILEPGEVH